MGKFTFGAGALVTVATLVFIDGCLSLEALPFPVVVPYLLSLCGFVLIALVDPFLLSSIEGSSIHATTGRYGGDPFLQVRHRASFVFGVVLMLLSTSIGLMMNALENDSTGCAGWGRASSWPGFSLVFQGWCWLGAGVCLYLDKCVVARSGFDSIMAGDE